MKPLIVLLVLALTISSLQGKSQKAGDDKEKEDADEKSGEEEEEEEEDFEGVRYMNKTSNATLAFNNVTGSLQVYNSTMKNSKLELQVLILEELDEDDMNVGEGEENAYHDVQMVEVNEWVLTEPENCTIEEGQSNITATCISANGTVKLLNGTNVVFKAALAGQDGIVDLDGEEIPVKAGNVRVSVIVENWLWCCKDNSTGCEVCPVPSEKSSKEKDSKESGESKEEEQELQIGKYLHVGLSLMTPDSKIKETAKFVFNRDKMERVGARQYGAGDGASLILSSQVSIDEKWKGLEEGFPKIQNKDSKTMITFRCEKFESSCKYDIIFTASSAVSFQASVVIMLIATIVTFLHSH